MHMNRGWARGSVLSGAAHAADCTRAQDASAWSPASPLASKGIPLICVESLDLHQAPDRLKSWMGVLEDGLQERGTAPFKLYQSLWRGLRVIFLRMA